MNKELARQIAAGPCYFPHTVDVDGERLLLIETDQKRLSEASFLDQRVLTPSTRGGWAPLDEVAAAAPADLPDDAGFIFHIGHCGSTLLSRLLDGIPGVLGIREPQSLRDMAAVGRMIDHPESPWSPAYFLPRLLLLKRLLARPFRSGQRVIVKPTSFVSDLAPALLADDAPAVFMYQSPRRYLETILAGENSRASLATLSGERLERLHTRIGDTPWRLWRMDEGQRIALGWAVEMASLTAAARALSAQSVLWLDFDSFLASPADRLRRVAGHFDRDIDADAAGAIVAGPQLRRYSKSPDHAYSPQLREQLLRDAGRMHRATIASGLAWLDAAGRAYPPIAAALDHVGGM